MSEIDVSAGSAMTLARIAYDLESYAHDLREFGRDDTAAWVEQRAKLIREAATWRPIESAPKDKPILVAAYIVPSEEAQRNGSRAHWDIAIGRAFGTKLDRWFGILGGKPSHWMPLPSFPQP